MIAGGIGSMPGEDFRSAQALVLDLLGDGGLPHLVELPARGAGASMIGRTLSLLPLDVDLQPAGWRLTGTDGAPGLDQRRARSLLAQDLDTLEELAQGLTGKFKIQLVGPWTLAAMTERPRGDKILADHGARRELAHALAEAAADHIADVRRRVGGAERLIVQLDEPAFSAVLNAQIPTASGFGQHRKIDIPEASELLGVVLARITAEGAEPWVHSCAPATPWGVVRGAGAAGLSLDLALAQAEELDQLGEALDAGTTLALGVAQTTGPIPAEKAVVERVLRLLDMLGFDPEEVGSQLLLTPACGLAGSDPAHARALTETLARAAKAANF